MPIPIYNYQSQLLCPSQFILLYKFLSRRLRNHIRNALRMRIRRNWAHTQIHNPQAPNAIDPEPRINARHRVLRWPHLRGPVRVKLRHTHVPCKSQNVIIRIRLRSKDILLERVAELGGGADFHGIADGVDDDLSVVGVREEGGVYDGVVAGVSGFEGHGAGRLGVVDEGEEECGEGACVGVEAWEDGGNAGKVLIVRNFRVDEELAGCEVEILDFGGREESGGAEVCD
jgi:hypothetical protein